MTTRAERFADKTTNELHSKVLKTLMKREDNRKCADCRKNDPRWASWNLGVFVCIRCSGIHRSMGTHISKVKSADLDTWTTEQVQNMVRWGNVKANAYWEHELPQGMDVPEHKIEQWIRAKYDRKQYVMKGDIPDPDSIPLPAGVVDVQLPAPFNRGPSVDAPPVVQSAPSGASLVKVQAPATASSQHTKQTSAVDDLFDAFQAAPSSSNPTTTSAQMNKQQQQNTVSLTANILSLYNSTSVASPVMSQQLASSGGFMMNQISAVPVPSIPTSFGNSTAPVVSNNTANFLGGLFDSAPKILSNNVQATQPTAPSSSGFDAFSALTGLSFPSSTPSSNMINTNSTSTINNSQQPPLAMSTTPSSAASFGFQSSPPQQTISNTTFTPAPVASNVSALIPDFFGGFGTSMGTSSNPPASKPVVPLQAVSAAIPAAILHHPELTSTQDIWGDFQS